MAMNSNQRSHIVLSIYGLERRHKLGQDDLMPRQMGIEYPRAIYHVLSRRDRREAILLDETNRHDFLKALAETWTKLWSDPFH